MFNTLIEIGLACRLLLVSKNGLQKVESLLNLKYTLPPTVYPMQERDRFH